MHTMQYMHLHSKHWFSSCGTKFGSTYLLFPLNNFSWCTGAVAIGFVKEPKSNMAITDLLPWGQCHLVSPTRITSEKYFHFALGLNKPTWCVPSLHPRGNNPVIAMHQPESPQINFWCFLLLVVNEDCRSSDEYVGDRRWIFASGLVGQDGGCETLGEFAPSGKSQQSHKWETEWFSTLC